MAALYNRVPIIEKVIYAGILAFSIYDYARLIDTGSVDRTVAILCLLLNCVIMYVIYSLVKICMKYMVKPHLIDIRNEFCDEGKDQLPNHYASSHRTSLHVRSAQNIKATLHAFSRPCSDRAAHTES